MILTYKVRHDRDFSTELRMARQVADFAVKHRSFSSKDVKHIGLKSMIANQILRKYGRSKTIKKARNVNLIVPSQGIKADHSKHIINVPCLKLSLPYRFPDFEKVNQIEVDGEYAYISVSILDVEIKEPSHYIGVDLNATGHAAVVGNPQTGKMWKLGKRCQHVHKKYKNIRRRLQKLGKYGMVKKIKDRESRIVRDLNHKMSRKIVEIAKEAGCGIKMEDLKGIRKTTKQAKSFRYSLNSWSFYQLRTFIGYKAKLQGVAVAHIEPAYTSKTCSRCGHMGNRNGKAFKCPYCGYVENADVNASFNIAKRQIGVTQSDIERDMSEGSTDAPQMATSRTMATIEPHRL
ncbi:RNA-guided endonuclease InsQ/TnpB family protein [Methanocella conradii]|uniref:RNA-guided endonuclease InsQ/TnpB family protein n=1 Tax=Methanocella conradii TaxID=1175444 RepID=UPI0024B32A6B|nr:transposase [Methanocella conradii]MDI6897826.1 transposase [Methanocella conradii]